MPTTLRGWRRAMIRPSTADAGAAARPSPRLASAPAVGASAVSTPAVPSNTPVSRDAASATGRGQAMPALYDRGGGSGLSACTDLPSGTATEARPAVVPMPAGGGDSYVHRRRNDPYRGGPDVHADSRSRIHHRHPVRGRPAPPRD